MDHRITSSIKDEALVKKRLNQLQKGAVQLFKQKDFTGRRPGKSPKRQVSASEHYMSTFEKRRCLIFSLRCRPR